VLQRSIIVCCAALGAIAIVAWIVWLCRRPGETSDGVHDVPLGVEAAAIIRYAGPPLVARPYRRGASVDVRIADQAQRGAVWVYDVRYVVSQPGEFDLLDYLASADGSALNELPSFKVRGLTSLTKQIESRIREMETTSVDIWHWYYETLVAAGVAWLLWLGGLIFIGRPKRVPPPPPLPPEPTVAELIVQLLDSLARNGLSVTERARLETLLFRHWRERLGLERDRMAATCRAFHRDDDLGRAYNAVEAWLHAPASHIDVNEIVHLCNPNK